MATETKRIFISSTIANLRYVRQAISLYVRDCGHIAYRSECPRFPTRGSSHPMDESIFVVQNASHFILLLGTRWGLEYHKDKSTSVTERESFEAKRNSLPILCFIESDTWREAAEAHKKKSFEGFATDARVLRFIDEHLMHGDVSWICPFHELEQIRDKLAASWLIEMTQTCRLMLVKDRENIFAELVDDYARSFNYFLVNAGARPVPNLQLPATDTEYIRTHRASGHELGEYSINRRIDRWTDSVRDVESRINTTLQAVYQFHQNQAMEYIEIIDVLRKALCRYLQFAVIRIYGDEAYGQLPNLSGHELSVKSGPHVWVIHENIKCPKEEVLALTVLTGITKEYLFAFVANRSFERWHRHAGSWDEFNYRKFLEEWAVDVIPQAMALSEKISDRLLNVLQLPPNEMTGLIGDPTQSSSSKFGGTIYNIPPQPITGLV